MFYVYGKIRTISMKIKEVTTPLAILDYFLPGVFGVVGFLFFDLIPVIRLTSLFILIVF
jgi:hypothetical protein